MNRENRPSVMRERKGPAHEARHRIPRDEV